MTVVGIGTRKKEFDIPTKNSQKIARIIRDGIQLKVQLEEIKQQIEANNQLIIPHAENLSGICGQKTVAFRDHNGKITVKFGDSLQYNEKDIPNIKDILGPLFDQVFTKNTTFAVNMVDIPEIQKLLGKNYERLIREQASYKHKQKIRDILSDGDSKISKELRDVIIIEPNKPSISFEKVAR